MYSILVLRLFTFPRTPAELSAGVGREWPDARGAFVMDSARPEIGQRMTGFRWLQLAICLDAMGFQDAGNPMHKSNAWLLNCCWSHNDGFPCRILGSIASNVTAHLTNSMLSTSRMNGTNGGSWPASA